MKAHAEQFLVEIPPILFEQEEKLREILQSVKSLGVARALAGNLGGIALAREAGLEISGDYGLNVTNRIALEAYAGMGLRDLTLSFELSLPRIRSLGGPLPRGMLAYGYLPLMAARNCPAGACGGCEKAFPPVTDRKGNRFFVDCAWKVSYLYNCVPLVLSDRIGELRGVDFLTLYFTREPPERCAEMVSLYRSGGSWEGERTRGLYYRNVR